MRPKNVDDFRIRESGVPGWGTENHGIAPFVRLRRGAGAGIGTAVLLALLLFAGASALAALRWPSETRRALEIARAVASSAANDLGLSPESASTAVHADATATAAATIAESPAPRATIEEPLPPAPASAADSAPRPARLTARRQVAVQRVAEASWPSDGELHIFVVDDENRPAAGARVRVVSVMETSATTPFDDFADEFGRIAVGPLGVGYVAITIEQESMRRTTRARIEPGLRTDVTIARPVGAAVIGVVRDLAGRPLPGVTVRSAPEARVAGTEGEIEDTFHVISDDSGIYRLVDVPIGAHELIVGDARADSAPAQRHVLEVDHRGTFTRDLTTDAPSATPLPSIQLPHSVGVARAQPAPSDPTVARTAAPRARQKTTEFPMRSAAPRHTPAPAATPVADASLRFRLTDERGEPLVGDVTVAMLPTAGAAAARTTNFKAYGRGTAVFHPAVPGSYRISLRAAGHEPATLLSEVTAGRNEIRAVLPRLPDPPARYVLEGTILDRATGHPLAGCRVVIRGEPDRSTVSTRDGRFAIDSPDKRPSGVWVTHDGYQSELVVAPLKGAIEVRLAPNDE